MSLISENDDKGNRSEKSGTSSSSTQLNHLPETRSRSGSRSRSRSKSQSYAFKNRTRSSTTNSFMRFISNNETAHNTSRDEKTKKGSLISFYRLLMLELKLPSTNELRPSPENQIDTDAKIAFEQLSNMIQIPYYLEKFVIFGLLVFLNSLLTLFTLVPLKIVLVITNALKEQYKYYRRNSSFNLRIAIHELGWVKRDIITITIIVLALGILSPKLDISRMYHDVRGEAHIKLYVMFGVLEVCDKLCSSIGQDIIAILYSIPMGSIKDLKKNGFKFFIFFSLTLIYLSFHAYILIYQTVSLNVAANSYSNALLALLLSNQFAELKGSVFKKFEREGLFQITMSDLTERFHLTLMLSIIAVRNLLQLNNTYLGLIPNSWKSWNTWFGATFGPGIVVLGSEILVDWLKHCYISKFNKLRPRIYGNFLYVLSLDFLEVFKSTPNSGANLSHELIDYIILTKRIGLPLLASIVCFLRMTLPDLKQIFAFSAIDSTLYSFAATTSLLMLIFLTLLFVRLLLALVLLKWSHSIQSEHKSRLSIINSSTITTSESKAENYGMSNPIDLAGNAKSDQSSLDIEENSLDRSREVTPSPYFPHVDETNRIMIDSNDIGDISASPQSPIELFYLPGIPNTEPSSINPSTRSYLYDSNEKVPLTSEEKRNKQILDTEKIENKMNVSDDEKLSKVMRYEMSSKRIW